MSLNLDGWTSPDRGALFIVTGASGTGKTTLVREALRRIPGVQFSVSATTRAPRAGERDGVDYRFLSREAFDSAVEAGDFLEWAEVHGNRYGTLKAPVDHALASGSSILLEIDRRGASQVREKAPEAISIFILPPGLETLEQRLRDRSTDSEEVIRRRVADAMDQIQHCGSFDFLLVNNVLESAHDQFQAILIAALLHQERRRAWVEKFTS
jgi:guanylate kinase